MIQRSSKRLEGNHSLCFFFANPFNHHNFFTVHALSNIGKTFVLCPPLQLQFLFGRWICKPPKTWLGLLPFILQVLCGFLFILLRSRLIDEKFYLNFMTASCNLIALNHKGLVWVHYQDYITLSDQARSSLKADICELIIHSHPDANNWDSTLRAVSQSTIVLSPNQETIHPQLEEHVKGTVFFAPYGGDKESYLSQRTPDQEFDFQSISTTTFRIAARANSYRKGLDTFIEALLILSNNPLISAYTNIHCIICGRITSLSGRRQFHEVVQKLENTNVTVTAAQLSPNDYISELRKSDLFVMPSRLESMSLAALEALWLGIPCVITSNCGISNFISGKHGFHLTHHDPCELAELISNFIRDKTLSPTLRSNLANDRNLFAWDDYFAAYSQGITSISKI